MPDDYLFDDGPAPPPHFFVWIKENMVGLVADRLKDEPGVVMMAPAGFLGEYVIFLSPFHARDPKYADSIRAIISGLCDSERMIDDIESAINGMGPWRTAGEGRLPENKVLKVVKIEPTPAMVSAAHAHSLKEATTWYHVPKSRNGARYLCVCKKSHVVMADVGFIGHVFGVSAMGQCPSCGNIFVDAAQ